jgi:hypothetical protein
MSAGLMVLAANLFFSAPARAETSWHRLERKLRKLEKKSGSVLNQTGDVLLKGVPVAVDFALSLFEEEDDSPTPRTPVRPPRPTADSHKPTPRKAD